MAESPTRVALLARPGPACDNLQAALRQAGAEVVAVQDPGDGDPAAIAAARPAAVLVALEPAVEDALERYDAVLSEAGRLVIYDEVAIAARREGWDAARWARHLAAKFGGHADVLPPGAGTDTEPAGPERVPEAASAQAAPAAEDRAEEFTAFDAEAIHLGVEPAHEDALAMASDGIDFGGFTPEMMEAMAMEPMSAPLPGAAEEERPAPVDFDEGLAFDDAPAVAEPAPAPDARAADGEPDPNILEWDATALSMPEPAPAPAPAEESAAAPVAPKAPSFNLDDMALVDMESGGDAGHAAPGPAPVEPAPAATTSPALAAAVSAPAAGEGSDGAVVVLAGIGGPDAVRQFLAALPGGFARPIVVRQRLDGGRHDRLVRQMQRATALPVELAEAGRMLLAGHVYILPDGMTTSGEGAATFVPTDAPVPVLAGLRAANSAVLVLSGSDPASVPELMAAARDGAYVAGQSPEDSFDGAAATALVAAGGESSTATELAQRVSARWQS